MYHKWVFIVRIRTVHCSENFCPEIALPVTDVPHEAFPSDLNFYNCLLDVAALGADTVQKDTQPA